mmetsp:Transcript_91544/g.179310  ORF Transcript_91544/g.179310 Transcript_91544/m.179310 type:complete len:221 (+) Transcript_91544:166-828(+)
MGWCNAHATHRPTALLIRLLRIATAMEEFLQPLLGTLLAELARPGYGGLQRLLHGGSRDRRSAHVEEAAHIQQVVGDELRPVRHLVRHKDHLRGVVRLVELEGAHELSKDTLLAEHLPLLLVEQLLLLAAATVKDDHRARGDAYLLLVELVLHEGADGRDARAEADHDHGNGVLLRELEGTDDGRASELAAHGGALDEPRARTGDDAPIAGGLPLVDDDG